MARIKSVEFDKWLGEVSRFVVGALDNGQAFYAWTDSGRDEFEVGDEITTGETNGNRGVKIYPTLDKALKAKDEDWKYWEERASQPEEAKPAPIVIENPWSGAIVEILPDDITQAKLDAMAVLMEDDIREQIHRDIAPCTPAEFFAEYVRRVGPRRAGEIWFS